MTVELRGYAIDRIAIIDDQPASRQSYGYTVENADLLPIDEAGPLGSLDEYVAASIGERADAALCDYQLNARRYAAFTGAQLVARWYLDGFPSVLCTRWEKAHLVHITPLRRWIPALLTPADLNEESLLRGIDECIYELQGKFRSHRRPWRTQVHFLYKDEDYTDVVFAELPGWEVDEVVKVSISSLPRFLREGELEDVRCHARANLGAQSAEELFLYEWEQS